MNWALRFGLRGPIVFFFKAFRLRYPFLRSNWETTCRLAGVPNLPSRRAICPRDKFVHFTSARIGSPAVWSSNTFKKFSSRAADISISFLRPPLFFGHDSCPDRRSLPIPPVPGGWSWDRAAARWRCTRHHHDPALWTRWRHTVDDRPRSAMHGQDMTRQDASAASFPLSVSAVGAWFNRSNRRNWSGSYGGVCTPRSRFVTERARVAGQAVCSCLFGSFPSASAEGKELCRPSARQEWKAVRLKRCW